MAGAKDLTEGNEHERRHRESIYAHVVPLDHLCRPLLVLKELHEVRVEGLIDESLVLLAPLELAVQTEATLFEKSDR